MILTRVEAALVFNSQSVALHRLLSKGNSAECVGADGIFVWHYKYKLQELEQCVRIKHQGEKVKLSFSTNQMKRALRLLNMHDSENSTYKNVENLNMKAPQKVNRRYQLVYIYEVMHTCAWEQQQQQKKTTKHKYCTECQVWKWCWCMKYEDRLGEVEISCTFIRCIHGPMFSTYVCYSEFLYFHVLRPLVLGGEKRFY